MANDDVTPLDVENSQSSENPENKKSKILTTSNNSEEKTLASTNPTLKTNIKEKAKSISTQWMEKNRSLVLRQTPIWANSLIVLLLSLGSIAVLGGIFIRIDEVITVGGQLKSIGGTVDIKTPAAGRVNKIYYADGDIVRKGQLLLQFDTREASEQKKTLTNLIDIEKNELASKLNTLKSQKTTLLSQKNVISQRLKTKTDILISMEMLVKEGGFQKIQYLESLDQKYALESNLSEIDEKLSQMDLRAEQLRLDNRKSLDRMTNQLKSAELRLQYENVTASTSGIVFDPQASEQGVLSSGERILSIVPQKGLFAEIYVPNQDIGYIKKGQETKVRVDAFPFTRYGELAAVVDQISADALPPDETKRFYSFPVKLGLLNSYLLSRDVRIPLKPGMSITANLKLRDKRLISILSDLLVDQSDSIRNIRQQ